MPTCVENSRRNFKAAKESTMKKRLFCRKCCKPLRCRQEKQREQKRLVTRRHSADDSVPGNLEPHALLVLPGHQSGVPRDVDHRLENERAAAVQTPMTPPITIIAPAHNEEG